MKRNILNGFIFAAFVCMVMGALAALVVISAAAPAYAADPSAGLGTGKKPNIVYILMDNLGYGEVGADGVGDTRGIPTPRWTAYDAKRFGVTMPPEVPMTTTERAYTSPIWYTPVTSTGLS